MILNLISFMRDLTKAEGLSLKAELYQMAEGRCALRWMMSDV